MKIKKSFRVVRATPAIIVVTGLLLCVCIGALGGLVKTAATMAAVKKNPIYSVETDKAEVSLGINCAWGNEDIPELLAVLDRYSIKATFFIVGDWCDKFPDSVSAIFEAGHDIGSHSDTHADMTKLDDAGILREIRDSGAKLKAVTGKDVTLFRVPSGAFNSHVVEMIENENIYPIQWDCEGMHMKTEYETAIN